MIHWKEFDFNSYKPTFKVQKKGKECTKYCDDIITLDTETSNYYIIDGKLLQVPYSKQPKWYRDSHEETDQMLCFDYYKEPEFYKTAVKQSVLYIWMVGINTTVVYGRTNEELKEFMDKLTNHLGDGKAIIYVHNLSFDFNFLQNSLGTDCTVFSRQQHKTIYIDYKNIMFRCSLFLTNKPLIKAAEEVNAPVVKLCGDLNYDIIRTPKTVLTEKELGYCENDILCLYYVIKYKLEKYKQVYNIPLTQTAQIKRALKTTMYNERQYKKQVKQMWPDYAQFELLKTVYYGGYVHSNARHTNTKLENVYSYDITSSYPYVLCTQKFPMSKFIKSYERNLNFLDTENYAYIVDITMEGVESKIDNTFLPIHKAQELDENGVKINYANAEIDNGRIRKCDRARYILTDCDVKIVNNAYKFKKVRINEVWTAKKDYLPAMLIAFILQLFNDKTQYKDMAEFESRYKEAKEFINGVYGMFVTKIISDLVTFEQGEWDTVKITSQQADNKLAEMYEQDQICSYSTGVWTSAFARKHVWDLILKVDRDVVYCDTDSVKFLDEKNIVHFQKDCEEVDRAIMSVCSARGLQEHWYKVAKPKGGYSELGYFESDGVYKEFKTLGAKKYAYVTACSSLKECKNCIHNKNCKDYKKELKANNQKVYIENCKQVHTTIAGVSKKTGAKYFKTLDDFTPGAYLGYQYAGKNMVKYTDNQVEFTFPDGFKATEKYGCVLTPTTYLLDITKDYESLLDMLLDSEYDVMNYNEGIGASILD